MAEDDVVFQEAVEALREGKKARARELAHGIAQDRSEQRNYWVWMSATMDTPKERIYCLQTALKMDPENATAKRGLILHGALPPDDTIQPFPVNVRAPGRRKLLLAHEKPKPKGWAAVKASPVARVGGFVAIGALIVSALVFGFIIPGANRVTTAPTNTAGPSPTYTLTPTFVNATGRPGIASTSSAPLSELLAAPHTATPLYVVTQRPPQSADMYRGVKLAFEKGDWDAVIRGMQDIITVEPEAADTHYYIGEAYRFKGDYANAINAYQAALAANRNFGPAYVGLARARLGLDPNADVRSFLDEAIRLDPNFGEAYLERAIARIQQSDNSGALSDLAQADSRLPNSPLVFFHLARARLQEDDLDLALSAAQRSNQLDVTLLPTYLLLAQIYAETGNDDEAVKALDIYLKYNANDAMAYLLLGEMHFNNREYEDTVNDMNRVLVLDRNRREPYLYRFLSNVELGRGEQADEDIDRVLLYYSNSFEARLAIIRLHILQERFGSAVLELDRIQSLAKTDEQKAQAYYWGAIAYENRTDVRNAVKYWQLLLDLPEDAMTAAMRTTQLRKSTSQYKKIIITVRSHRTLRFLRLNLSHAQPTDHKTRISSNSSAQVRWPCPERPARRPRSGRHSAQTGTHHLERHSAL
jgi:tetratricopeptide (TPR) repeat protein